HAVAIALAQKNKGSFEAQSIVQAASTRVRFCLSTMPLCSGVQAEEVCCPIPSSLKNALSVLFKNYVPLSVRIVITHAVAIASAQKNKGSFEAQSIVRAASTRVKENQEKDKIRSKPNKKGSVLKPGKV
nr:hypothetical protein [Tanacetum cinerariifolium]